MEWNRCLNHTQKVHLVFKCPVPSQAKRVDDALVPGEDLVHAHELVPVHLLVQCPCSSHSTRVPGAPNPLQNSKSFHINKGHLTIQTYLQMLWSGRARSWKNLVFASEFKSFETSILMNSLTSASSALESKMFLNEDQ